MRRLFCILAYDGTPYLGWQKTNMGPSVEGVLEQVLRQITQEKTTLEAASRTDAGVHAVGQVVAFQTACRFSVKRLQFSLNGLLPPEIRILDLHEAACDFHPTLDNHGKIYHYTISTAPVQLPQERLYAWHYYYPLDIDAMRSAAERLVGQHNFTAFCNVHSELARCNCVRTLQKLVVRQVDRDHLRIELQADSFLYRMARNLVGTLAYVGRGKLRPSEILPILRSKRRSRAGITAPAQGLTLVKVFFNKVARKSR